MLLSLVTTLYYSAPHLPEFYARACSSAEQVANDFEIILVNDGSPDDSLDLAVSLFEKDERVKVIDLSRNFGHHRAIMTGLAHAKGETVFLVDSDLEEEPELLNRFHSEMKETRADVVYGVQQKRKGGWLERFGGVIYFKLFNMLSNHPVPPNHITARLMSRRYVAALVEHREREICLSGIWAITGFKQVPVAVTKHRRNATTYSFRRRAYNFVNGITSFSNKPLVLIFYLGCLILILSGTAALYLIIRRLFFGVLLSGWPSLIVSIWLLGGLTIFCLGVIGIYLSKIFEETKRRPYALIREIYEHREPAPSFEESTPGPRRFERAGQMGS